MEDIPGNGRIRARDMKPGDLIRPTHPATWFPVDYETMDVWKPKEWMLQSCELYDEDRRPLVYVGMVHKRIPQGRNSIWVDRTQQGRHMVYYEGDIYFITPNAWKFIERVGSTAEPDQEP
jgi:hypothetical protein